MQQSLGQMFSFGPSAPNDNMIEEGWKMIEDLTTNAYEIQQNVLDEILTQNLHTEYLDKFLNGHFDKKVFKEKVPIIDYEGIRPYMERMGNGEPSDILLAEPLIGFALTTGTGLGGKSKIMPMTAKDLNKRTVIRNTLPWSVINKCTRFIDGLEQGKGMYLLFVKPDIITPCGLRATPTLTSCMKTIYFENLVPQLYTSPYPTIVCLDLMQSMYCQLLCGLLRRDEVVRIGASFAYILGRAIRFLKEYWMELCANIRTGELSDWITDVDCRNALSFILHKPNLRLADLVESIFRGESWEGIMEQLWPRTKYVDVIVTGPEAQYIPMLKFYFGDNIPLVSTYYASSEGYLGINLKPSSNPSDISYTLLPNMAFYEFIPLKTKEINQSGFDCAETESKEDEDVEPVELGDVKVGQYYEIVVTTFSGLYRYKIGDILMATGFHNAAPQFRFVERKGEVLGVGEDGILKAITKAMLLLEPIGFILIDYTTYVDETSTPVHHILFWELKMKQNEDSSHQLDPNILQQCCSIVEECLDVAYRVRRNRNSVGPLEIRVVKHGTFDMLMDFLVSKGSSFSQYKTPRRILSGEAFDIMDSRVVGSYFSHKLPSDINNCI